jgi:hypothetical protein
MLWVVVLSVFSYCQRLDAFTGFCFNGTEYTEHTIPWRTTSMIDGDSYSIKDFGLASMYNAVRIPPVLNGATIKDFGEENDVLIGILFSSDVDALEILLTEYANVADVIVFEGGSSLLWRDLYRTSRFERFNNVKHYVCHVEQCVNELLRVGRHYAVAKFSTPINYCYLPNIIIRSPQRIDVCGIGLDVIKAGCYTPVVWPSGVNVLRFPAMIGEVDKREQLLFDTLCGNR